VCRFSFFRFVCRARALWEVGEGVLGWFGLVDGVDVRLKNGRAVEPKASGVFFS